MAVGKDLIGHWYGWRSDEGSVTPGETGKGGGAKSGLFIRPNLSPSMLIHPGWGRARVEVGDRLGGFCRHPGDKQWWRWREVDGFKIYFGEINNRTC